jgi:hypothetical protein
MRLWPATSLRQRLEGQTADHRRLADGEPARRPQASHLRHLCSGIMDTCNGVVVRARLHRSHPLADGPSLHPGDGPQGRPSSEGTGRPSCRTQGRPSSARARSTTSPAGQGVLSFGLRWVRAATVAHGQQRSPPVPDGSEKPQVAGPPAHAAGMMRVGDSDCGRKVLGGCVGQQTGSNRCP